MWGAFIMGKLSMMSGETFWAGVFMVISAVSFWLAYGGMMKAVVGGFWSRVWDR